MRILVTPTSMQADSGSAALEELKKFSEDLVFNPAKKPMSEDELIEALQGCEGYVAGLDHITAKVFENCPDLKVISRYGVGYDRVDIEAAKKHGVIVTNTPGVNAEAVGELAFGLLLAVARKIPKLDQDTRAGGWMRSTGFECLGKTICILGLGAIGKVVARCAKGFGMKVCAYDPYINEAYCAENGIQVVSFEEGISMADVISLHLPLMESTRYIIDEKTIASMKDGAVLINASRGGLIDEKAAYDALKSGKLGGMGLDAFEEEPPKDSPLFEFDSVVVTPHTGAHTAEATYNMASLSVKNLIEVFETGDCRYIVNR